MLIAVRPRPPATPHERGFHANLTERICSRWGGQATPMDRRRQGCFRRTLDPIRGAVQCVPPPRCHRSAYRTSSLTLTDGGSWKSSPWMKGRKPAMGRAHPPHPPPPPPPPPDPPPPRGPPGPPRSVSVGRGPAPASIRKSCTPRIRRGVQCGGGFFTITCHVMPPHPFPSSRSRYRYRSCQRHVMFSGRSTHWYRCC